MGTYIISDLHGCFYTLEKLVDKVRKKDESPQFVFIGDYVDRGLNSKQCVEFVINLQSEGAVCLRGNHDDVIDFIINAHCVSDFREFIPDSIQINQLNIAMWWTQNGLFSTIRSYVNIKQRNSLDFICKLFVDAIPEEHRKFFRGLRMHWENDTHFACHAFLNPRESLPRTLEFVPESANHDMLWSRFPISYTGLTPTGVDCDPVWDKIGVFGHSPASYYGRVAPIKHGNLRLIDTGAFQGEYMTAYCAEQDDHILQSTDSRDIA